MKFSKATLSLLLCFFCTILMREPQTTNTDDVRIQESIEKFNENVEKTLNSGAFNVNVPPQIRWPRNFEEFVFFINAIGKINSETKHILGFFVVRFFEEYIKENEIFNTTEDRKNTYLKRLKTLQIICKRVYQIFYKNLTTYDECQKLFDRKKDVIKKLIFSDEEVLEKAYEKIVNDQIDQPSKEELTSIQSRYFANIPRSKISSPLSHIPSDTLRRTKDYLKAAVEILKLLNNTLVDPFKKEYNANTVIRRQIFSYIDDFQKNAPDKDCLNALVEKYLNLCECELKIWRCMKENRSEINILNLVYNEKSYVDTYKDYQNSLNELLKYLEGSNNKILIKLKEEFEKMKTNISNKVLNINSYLREKVKTMKLNIADGQIKRLENEKIHLKGLLSSYQ